MITFVCPHCGKTLRVKPEFAGKKGKCPHCTRQAVVPASSDTSAVEDARTLVPVPPSSNGVAASRADDSLASPAAPGVAAERYDFLAPAQAPDELGRLGRYRVLSVLGSGGMGVVFRGEDPTLQRTIALKVMLPTLAASPSAKERFLREARAAAALEHDHVIAVYEVNEDRGVPYLAMPFLQGESLEDRLQREGRLPTKDVLRIGREAAEGLGAAHKRGMIHRDIKPGNLWLEGERGRVKILDFGLAKAAGGESQLTQQGAIIGTPAYMAPEQGAGKPLDGRCDLFSLGVVLYRMATGRLPFKGTDTVSTLMAVATERPPVPRKICEDIPPALSDLVMSLLAKDPADRASSAEELARELEAIKRDPHAAETMVKVVEAAPRRVQRAVADPEDEGTVTPTEARRPRRPRKAKQGIPLWAWVAAGAGGLLILGLVVTLAFVLGRSRAPGTPVQNPPPNVPGQPALTVAPVVPPVQAGESGVTVDQLAVLSDPRVTGEATSIVFGPEGKWLASSHGLEPRPETRGAVLLWDVASKKATRMLEASHKVHSIALNRAATQLAAATYDWRRKDIPGELIVWDPANGQEVFRPKEQLKQPMFAAFTPDAARLASRWATSSVRLWDPATGTPVHTFHAHDKGVACLCFSPDGKRLATGGTEGEGKIWDTTTWQLLHTLRGHAGPWPWLQQIQYSPDGKMLVSVAGDFTARMWDMDTGQELHTFRGHSNQVYGLAFTPDSRWMATSSGDGSVKIWEPKARKEVGSFRCSNRDVYGLAFSPDGSLLAVATQEGPVYLYRIDFPK